MNNLLSKDDVVDIFKATKQGESCLCSSKWLLNLANKITNTLEKLQELQPNQIIFKKEKINWSGQLMYKHRGFSIPRYEDLGFIFADTKDEAFLLAFNRAQNWIDDTFKEKEIEYWDVKVKPYLN